MPGSRYLVPPFEGNYAFELPREDVELSRLFKTIEENKERLAISDWGLTETTLEEVFLKICATDPGTSAEDVRDVSLSEYWGETLPDMDDELDSPVAADADVEA